ncbi:MAG: RES family NAD+ phosphorylase [Clostridia bacterium]|nr:RES family NAD+ phosphorylase [Clostridia bacterium]
MEYKFHSQYLREFINEITYHNRNPRDIKALELMDDISTNPEILLSEKDILYRSRIIRRIKDINKVKNFYGFDEEQSFVPPKEKTCDMRANYRYIPYLYCTNHPYLSLVEIRPRLSSLVSIATISVNEKLSLLDFTNSNKPSKMTKAKEHFFSDLSYMFSKPISDEDDTKDYIPTQFIAEYAKNLGYDGIVYRSSLVPEINSAGLNRYNIVIFNYLKCAAIKSNVIQITNNYFDGEQVDDDTHKLAVSSYVVEMISQL